MSEVNSNNKRQKLDIIEEQKEQDVSLFYGITIQSHYFWLYLLQHDPKFQKSIVPVVRKSDDEFRKYNTEDIIDDLIVAGDCVDVPDYKPIQKRKSEDTQCADSFTDCEFTFQVLRLKHVHSIKCYMYQSKNNTEKIIPHIPISLFPNCDIEYHHLQNKTDLVYIGKRIPLYKDGLLLDNIPKKLSNFKFKDELVPVTELSQTSTIGIHSITKSKKK